MEGASGIFDKDKKLLLNGCYKCRKHGREKKTSDIKKGMVF